MAEMHPVGQDMLHAYNSSPCMQRALWESDPGSAAEHGSACPLHSWLLRGFPLACLPVRQALDCVLNSCRGAVGCIPHCSLLFSFAGHLCEGAIVLEAADITDGVWSCKGRQDLKEVLYCRSLPACDPQLSEGKNGFDVYLCLYVWRLAVLLEGVSGQQRPDRPLGCFPL